MQRRKQRHVSEEKQSTQFEFMFENEKNFTEGVVGHRETRTSSCFKSRQRRMRLIDVIVDWSCCLSVSMATVSHLGPAC